MTKIVFSLLLLIPLHTQAQECLSLKETPLIRQAIEFSMLEATLNHGIIEFYKDTSYSNRHFEGNFPVREPGGIYKLVFWTNQRKPQVVATVIFHETISVGRAVIDTLKRTMTPAENQALQLLLTAEIDMNENPKFTDYPGYHFNVIAMNTAWGRKVFVTWRSKDPNKMFFGADYELTYNDRGELLTMIKMHEHTSVWCGKRRNGDESSPGIGIHHHSAEDFQGLSISDLGEILFYEKLLGLKKFIISDKKYVYDIDVSRMHIDKYTQDEYKKLKLPWPELVKGCKI